MNNFEKFIIAFLKNSNTAFGSLHKRKQALFNESVGNIKTGDIMLWGDNCLVLFYENFSTSYSYTKIGYIENPTDFSEALGLDDVAVEFETDNGDK